LSGGRWAIAVEIGEQFSQYGLRAEMRGGDFGRGAGVTPVVSAHDFDRVYRIVERVEGE
jgi:hypothetical protein